MFREIGSCTSSLVSWAALMRCWCKVGLLYFQSSMLVASGFRYGRCFFVGYGWRYVDGMWMAYIMSNHRYILSDPLPEVPEKNGPQGLLRSFSSASPWRRACEVLKFAPKMLSSLAEGWQRGHSPALRVISSASLAKSHSPALENLEIMGDYLA